MKLNQISAILNSVLAAYLEPEQEFAADLSNVFEIGKTLAEGAFSDNTINTIIDKVAATIFENPELSMDIPTIRKQGSEFRGAIETIKVTVGQGSDNESWDVLAGMNSGEDDTTNNFERMFGAEFPTVEARYYNTINTDSFKYTTFEDQFRNSFPSADKMAQFFGAVATAVRTQCDFRQGMRDKLAFCSAVVAHLNEYPTSIVAADFTGTTKNEQLASFNKQLKKIVRDLNRFDDKNKGFVTSIPKSHLKMYINADKYDDMRTALYDAHNPEFLNIPMENVETFVDLATSGNEVKLKVANSTASADTLSNVIAVIYDTRAVMTCYDNERVKTVPVPNREITNHFIKWNSSQYINLDYPMIVITENGAADFVKGE